MGNYLSKCKVFSLVKNDSLFVRISSGKFQRCKFSDVIFIKINGRLLNIVLVNQIIEIPCTLKYAKMFFEKHLFININKGIMVNIRKIDYLEKDRLFVNSLEFKIKKYYSGKLIDKLTNINSVYFKKSF